MIIEAVGGGRGGLRSLAASAGGGLRGAVFTSMLTSTGFFMGDAIFGCVRLPQKCARNGAPNERPKRTRGNVKERRVRFLVVRLPPYHWRAFGHGLVYFVSRESRPFLAVSASHYNLSSLLQTRDRVAKGD